MPNSHEKSGFEKSFFAEYELDRARRQLLKDGRPVTLTAKAFDLLLFLTDNAGRVVSKEELLDSLWNDQFVEESNLSVQVSAIRKALGDNHSEPRFLATIPGKGYQFVAEISRSGHQATQENSVKANLPRPGARESGRPVYLAAALVGLAILGTLAFVVAWSYLGTPDSEIRSIAVLPFENKDGTDYLGEGLAESVIFSLSRLPDLKVLSSGSSFRYRSEKPDAIAIGRDLGVEAILTGRVMQSGDTISVRTELVSARDNSVLWGEQLTRKSSDLEELQADIARTVGTKLRSRRSGDTDEARLKSNQTENDEAYKLYLIGRHHMNRLTDDGFAKGRDSFQMAIEKDPSYALAHAALADSYNMLCGWGGLAPNEGYPLARSAALRSLQLDGSLAEGYAALGIIKLSYDNDWIGAERDLDRAIELNPNLVSAYQYLNLLYVIHGRFDEAKVSIGRARELDPLSILNIIMLGNVYYFQRQPARAVEAYSQAVEMDNNSGLAHWSLGNAYLLENKFDDAISEYQKSHLLSGDSPDETALLAYAYAVSGRPGEARKILNELTGRKGYVPPSLIAAIYGALGEKDKAFELMEEAFANKDAVLLFLAVDPVFDPLRSDVRYPVLLKRLSL